MGQSGTDALVHAWPNQRRLTAWSTNNVVRDWCAANQVELVFTPTYASWANPRRTSGRYAGRFVSMR